MLLRSTNYGDDDGLLPQIRDLQLPVLRGQRHAVAQEGRAAERARERDAREAEPEEPGAARLAEPCDPSSLGVEEYGGDVSSARATPTDFAPPAAPAPAQSPGASTPPTDAADEAMAKAARTTQRLWRWRPPLAVVTSGQGFQQRLSLQRLKKHERLLGARARLQQQRLAEVQISPEWRAQLTEALDEGEQAVVELQQAGRPAGASRMMALQQKVALGTIAKQGLTGDAHASLTGGKPLRLLGSEDHSVMRLLDAGGSRPTTLVGREVRPKLPPELQRRATRRGIGALVPWRRDGPAAQASSVADAMTRAVRMPDHTWRGLQGKRTREAAGLSGKLSEYEGGLRSWERERCEAQAAVRAAAQARVFDNAELMQKHIFPAVIGVDSSATSGWVHQSSPEQTVAGTRCALRVLQCVCKSWRDAMGDFRLSLAQRAAAKTARAAAERNLQTDARGERQDERVAEAGAVSTLTPAAQPAALGSTVTTPATAIAAAAPAISATPESAAIGGDDMEDNALGSDALPDAGNLNPSP